MRTNNLPPIGPRSSTRLTLLEFVLALLAVGGAGYSVGLVHAQLEAHERSGADGHPQLAQRISTAELTLERITTLLELQQRQAAK